MARARGLRGERDTQPSSGLLVQPSQQLVHATAYNIRALRLASVAMLQRRSVSEDYSRLSYGAQPQLWGTASRSRGQQPK